MKKVLLIALLICTKQVEAQTNVYQLFPTDSASWCYRYSPMTGSESVSTAAMLGDTIINLKTYTKVFGSGLIGIGNAAIGMRQDIPNEKIYAINSSGVEMDVSVSQHLLVGDTFPSFVFGVSQTIQGIDSALIINKYHKEYQLQYGRYIVGVGKSAVDGDTWYTDLLCYNVGSPLVACNVMPPQCNYASIRQLKNNANIISIYPNPASTSINVELKIINENSTLQITDMLGNTVKQFIIHNPTSIISVADLSEGVYNISISSNDGVVNKRLVIVK